VARQTARLIAGALLALLAFAAGAQPSSPPRPVDPRYAERLKTWEAWEDVSNAAMGEPQESMKEWIEQLAPGTLDQA